MSRRMELFRKIWDFAAFQAAWFAAVVGAAAGVWQLGPRVMLFVVVVHLAITPRRLRETSFLVAAGVLGTGLDAIQIALGHLTLSGGIWLAGLPPLWMTALWVGFATMFATTMEWMRGRYALAAILGAVSGPLAYIGGAKLGAIDLHPDTVRLSLAVALQYAAATPLLLYLSRRMIGGDAVERPASVGAAEVRPT